MIDVDELREQIRILLWFPQSWNDDYLKWNESEWSNITQINLPATTVWIPDGHIFNTVSSEEVLPLSSTNARISSSGKVEVDFNKLLDVRCVLRVLEFPFDSQECALQFGSWSYQTHQLVHNAKPTFVPEINENSEWDILAFNTEKIRKKYPTTTGEEIEYEEIFFKLMIKRKPLYYVVVFIIPSFLIVAVSIAGLFIPSTAGKERQEKLNLGLTTLLTLSIMLGMIASEMPKSAEGLPLLGRFVIAETALSIIAMTVSALILCWNERTASNEEKPPEWMLRALGDPDTNAELLDADLTLARSRHASVGEEQSPLIMKNNGNVRSLSSVFGGGPIHEQLAFLFRYYSEKKRAEYYENGMILNADHDSVLWAASAAVLVQFTICVACGIICGSKSKKPVTPKSPQPTTARPQSPQTPAPVIVRVRKEVKPDSVNAKEVSKPKPKAEKKPEKKLEVIKKKQRTEEKTAEPKPDSENRAEPKSAKKLVDDGQYANLEEVPKPGVPANEPHEKTKDEKVESASEKVAKSPKRPKDTDEPQKKNAAGPRAPAKSVDNQRREPNVPDEQYANLDLDEKKPLPSPDADVKPPAKKLTTPQPKSPHDSRTQTTNANEEDDAFEKKVDRSEMKTEVVPESQRHVET
ncbi:Protein LGC-11 [Aphelenchoides avenae]|nr:Protein LGC-11 [Aphelenchus avenae]